MVIKQLDGTPLSDKSNRNVNGVNNSFYMKDKSIGGFGEIKVISHDSNESIDKFWNLVVFLGREFVASKVSNLLSGTEDNSNRKIAYFGVGSGGADASDSSIRFGPTLDDTDMHDPKKFVDSGINQSSNDYLYMKDGYLKRITSDNAKIETESHEYVNQNGDTVTEDKKTVVHYTIKIEKDEMLEDTFRFNEAGLYTIDFDSSGNPIDGTDKLFARLTTSNKEKERTESILIEWYVLT